MSKTPKMKKPRDESRDRKRDRNGWKAERSAARAAKTKRREFENSPKD